MNSGVFLFELELRFGFVLSDPLRDNLGTLCLEHAESRNGFLILLHEQDVPCTGVGALHPQAIHPSGRAGLEGSDLEFHCVDFRKTLRVKELGSGDHGPEQP